MTERRATNDQMSEYDGRVGNDDLDGFLLIDRETRGPEIHASFPEEDLDKYHRYNMKHPDRGVALIFNNFDFKNYKHLKQRSGAEIDEVVLRRTLSNIGFDVRAYDNLTLMEILIILSNVAMEDHTNRDCLFVTIMTHGEENGQLYASDNVYSAQKVWGKFNGENAPSLVGKPKIFLFQACRGSKIEENALLIDSTDAPLSPSSKRSFIVPSNADFLIAYSAMEGYFSFRNVMEGSWFIQDFCKEVEANIYKRDFLSILTRVLRRVSYNRSSNIPHSKHLHGRHQMPVFFSTLTRDVYFYEISHAFRSKDVGPGVPIPSNFGMDEIDRQTVIQGETFQGSTVRQKPIEFIEDELPDFERYKVNHLRRGVALIFNHKTFESSSVEERECADKDGQVISNTLNAFGFNVRLYRDNSLAEIKKVLSDVAKEDHTDCDCLLVVIMTHGEENGVLHAKDDTYKTKDVWDRFTPEKVPSLEGKPKIFLFQACRGDKSQTSTKIIDSTDFPSSGKSIIPSHADFLLAYSCVEGHYSFKNKEGSWFIQDFCTELKKNSQRKDILLLLTDTFRRVVFTRKSNNPYRTAVHEKQQIPAFNSTLTKLLYL